MKALKVLDKIINNVDKKTAIAIGCFDGIHRGHQQVIKKVLSKKEVGMVPAVFTFAQNPKFIFSEEKESRIVSLDEKYKILSDMGVDIVYNIDFLTIRYLSAQEFIKDILVEKLNVGYVACGFNFKFGYRGEATAQDLKNLCRSYNIEVDIITPVFYKNLPISSTRIRKILNLGDIRGVSELLGRPFNIKSLAVKKDDFINNIENEYKPDYILPICGMYISSYIKNKNGYYAVTKIEDSSAKTYFIDYKGNELYNKVIEIEILFKINI